jgi:hypothetical protein
MAASPSALSAAGLSGAEASPPITTSWCLPLEPSMMVTVRCSPGAASFGSLLAACAGAVVGAAAFSSEGF